MYPIFKANDQSQANTYLSQRNESKDKTELYPTVTSMFAAHKWDKPKVFTDAFALKNWTKEENSRLIQAVQSCGGKCWKKIAELMPGRSDEQCYSHFQIIDPSLNHSPWTLQEETELLALAEIHGNNWHQVSKELTGRSIIQCRERFRLIKKRKINPKSQAVGTQKRKRNAEDAKAITVDHENKHKRARLEHIPEQLTDSIAVDAFVVEDENLDKKQPIPSGPVKAIVLNN